MLLLLVQQVADFRRLLLNAGARVMAAVRRPTDNSKKNNSLNCADAKSYLLQATSKNDASLCVCSALWISIINHEMLNCYRPMYHCSVIHDMR